MKKNILIFTALLFSASFSLNSCSKDSNDNNDMSTVNVRLTDAPTDYDEVNVDIQQVMVKFTDDALPNDNWIALTPHPGIYNLLAYQNGVDTLLATGVFPVQEIKEIRLILGANNTIKVAGVLYPLTIPSGSESGLKIKINRMLHATLENIIIDFDAALSIHQEGTGDYKLRPVIRIQ